MNRRSFMSAILATACAPAIVRADSLMRIVSREQLVLVTQYFGDPFTGPMFAYQEYIWKAMQLVSDQIDADGLKLIQLAR